jgi:large subunit ribosomal protein L33
MPEETRPVEVSLMAKKKSKREDVWLECSQCGSRNYRTNISVAEGTPKLELRKFCSNERTRTAHKIRRK